MNYFSVNLKTLRNEKKLSQSQLAKELGVSNGMISFWENNIYEHTATNIITIANFFKKSLVVWTQSEGYSLGILRNECSKL